MSLPVELKKARGKKACLAENGFQCMFFLPAARLTKNSQRVRSYIQKLIFLYKKLYIWYSSPSVMDLEQQGAWVHTWLCVGGVVAGACAYRLEWL
jgi:hypothetical protein